MDFNTDFESPGCPPSDLNSSENRPPNHRSNTSISACLTGTERSLTTADISDSAGAQMILDAIRTWWPWIKHLFADGAYDRGQLMDKAAFLAFVIEIVRRVDAEPGFKVIPRRWVVERTFGWMTRWRRLVRDYEPRADVSEAMIHIAMGSLIPRRIAHP